MQHILRTIGRSLLLLFFLAANNQAKAQISLKNNLLYDASLTPNVSMEVGLSPKWTFDLTYGINPWTFSDNKKWRHWLLQPEFRYWFCHRFNGSFVGIHAFGGQYNAYGIKPPFGWWDELENYRHEGWFVGGGVAYGYQWVLSRHWNFEASVGVGAAYIYYDRYNCEVCGPKIDDGDKIYIGPTKLALSLLYMF